MKGTRRSVTEASRLMPPRMTTPARVATAMPTASGERPKEEASAPEMELAWVMLPMPKEAAAQKTAKRTASQRQPSPRSM